MARTRSVFARRLTAAFVAVALAGLTTITAVAPTQAATNSPVTPRILAATALNQDGYDYQFTTFGHRTIFSGFDAGGRGQEPWITDGTPTGTHMLKDTTALGSAPLGQFTVVGSKLYFVTMGKTNFYELWITDGTSAGTKLVKTRFLGAQNGYPNHLTALGNKLIFNVSSGIPGETRQLWVSDGTTTGTTTLKNYDGSPQFSDIGSAMATLNGRVYFQAWVPSSGTELWTTDGTKGGTHIFIDLLAGSPSSGVQNLHVWNGKLFFVANTDTYASDGTVAGTKPLRAGGSSIQLSNGLYSFAPFGNKEALYAYVNGKYRFVITDGTSAGTAIVPTPADLFLGANIATANGKVFFSARHNGSTDEELWSTDGSVGGTKQVKDIYPGMTGSWPDNITAVGNRVVFTATDIVHGEQLWTSDGTSAGTVRLNHQLRNPDDVNLTASNGMLFLSDAGTHGIWRQPWVWEPGPTYLSWTTLSISKSFHYGSRPTITVKVGSSVSLTRRHVVVSDGAKKLATLTLVKGKATWRLPTTFKLGKHTLKAVFAAQGSAKASSASTAVTVSKAVPKVTAALAHAKVAQTAHASMTVHVTAANLWPSGKLTVTIKKGKTTAKTLTTRLTTSAKGRHVFTFPKLAKGSYTAATHYAGSSTITSANAKTVTLTVT